MTLLNPILFWAAVACVSIPVLVHLLMRRRRRPVPWGAMQFLLQAYRKQRKRMKLEQFLLLAGRCLLVLLLAAALGKPVLGAAGLAGGRPARTVYILVDNSISSGAVLGGQTDLERSIGLAQATLDGLDGGRGDRAAVLAMGGPAEVVVWPPSRDASSVREALRDLRPTDSRADLSGALDRVRGDLPGAQSAGEAEVVLLSAWREGSADLSAALQALPGRVRVRASPAAVAEPDNIAVAEVRPLRSVVVAPNTDAPSVPVRLEVTLRRMGSGVSGGVSVPVVVRAGDDGASTTTEAVFAPGQAAWTRVVEVEFSASRASQGALRAVASVASDGLAGDNTRRVLLESRERLRVVVLTSDRLGVAATIDRYTPADWLALAIGPDADVGVRRRQEGDLTIETQDPSRAGGAGVLAGADALLIPRPDLLDEGGWKAVGESLGAGALVVVFPPPAAQTHLWPDAMAKGLGVDVVFARESVVHAPAVAVSPVTSSRGLLAMVGPELPELAKPVSVLKSLPLIPGGSSEPLLQLADGSVMLASLAAGGGSSRGLLVLSTVAMDLSWTDLPTKPLMVPLLQEVVRQGVGRAAGNGACDAGAGPALGPGVVELVRIGAGEGPQRAAVTQGRLEDPIRHAGFYAARGATGVATGEIAFDPDLVGARLAPAEQGQLSRWLVGLGAEPEWLGGDTNAPGGTGPAQAPPISLPLLAAALVLAAVEAVVARFASHASPGREEPAP